MATVELIYDRDFPNVSETRSHLLRAFAATQQPPCWVEWERSDPASPHYVRDYGSPTVLIEGKDAAGATPSEGVSCCRLYASPSGVLQGAPAAIVSAMQTPCAGVMPTGLSRKSGWLNSLAILPGISATLLPVGLCPVCWPAYAGLLSAIVLGFHLNTVHLLPVTALLLVVAVGALAFRAGSRRGYGPCIVGLAGSAIILIGKFVFVSDAAMYGGVVLLVAASIWNAWPRKSIAVSRGVCPASAPGGQAPRSQQPGAKEVSS